MVGIIVKNYAHFNTALPNWNTPKGVYVKSKDHYDRLCKESGMVSYDKAKQQASKPTRKEYVLSGSAKEIIEAAKRSKDKKGNVKLSDRTIDAMVKLGAINKKIPSHVNIPSKTKGGFA
jgi:hypothetical protein